LALSNVPEESRSQILMYLTVTFHIIPRQFIFLFPSFVVSSFKLNFITGLCHVLRDLFTTVSYDEAPFKMYCYKHTYVRNEVGRDSAVCIATRYGLDGPVIETRLRRDFPYPTRLTLGPTRPPIPVMGKLFKEGAKGKEKNFRRANIIY